MFICMDGWMNTLAGGVNGEAAADPRGGWRGGEAFEVFRFPKGVRMYVCSYGVSFMYVILIHIHVGWLALSLCILN
jgi:hypothetical protein